LEESDTYFGLKIAYLATEWRLRNMQPLGRLADTFLFRHSDKIPQMSDVYIRNCHLYQFIQIAFELLSI
jgi:hypothetical protein